MDLGCHEPFLQETRRGAILSRYPYGKNVQRTYRMHGRGLGTPKARLVSGCFPSLSIARTRPPGAGWCRQFSNNFLGCLEAYPPQELHHTNPAVVHKLWPLAQKSFMVQFDRNWARAGVGGGSLGRGFVRAHSLRLTLLDACVGLEGGLAFSKIKAASIWSFTHRWAWTISSSMASVV